MMMKGAFFLFMSLAVGYVLCILANKQKKGLLQTVGYALGAGIITLSLLYGALDGCAKMCKKGHMYGKYRAMKCNSGMFPGGQVR
ncbi:MAG: hypothetical protein WC419_02220 [Candidatus Omnitrophota bacterium]|jgi:hypothetical protein|nr:hypothetical protein [Candidatus Omnitrophota bacterium]